MIPTSPLASDPMVLVRELTSLPHRGATTANERLAAELLEARLREAGAEVHQEPFRTPPTYIATICWFASGLVAALLASPWAPWAAALAGAFFGGCGLLFLDYRWSPLSALPPQRESRNVVARRPGPAAPGATRVLVMAHYDSAPVSLLWLPRLVKGFRRSLYITAALILFTAASLVASAAAPHLTALAYLRWALALYFVVQVVLSSADFLRFGHTNGAADNASGTAAAAATALRLWADLPPDVDLTLVLTSAEEVGMIGAGAYAKAHRGELDPARTLVLNFDNVGAGDLGIVETSGSLTTLRYDNRLTQEARRQAQPGGAFPGVRAFSWHTGDFDTLPFARVGIPCLTLLALDANGCIPNLHRPTDTLPNVEPELPCRAADFGVAVLRGVLAARAAHEPKQPTPAVVSRRS
ncbi:MAG: M28 family metallopeptidase [Myxococcaceae bacterium]